MKNGLRSKILVIFILLALCSVFLFACDKTKANPYATENNFVVRTTDTDDALEFAPVSFTPKYGVVFYVGAMIEPTFYSYLGEALAKQGYLVVIPKLENNLAFSDYELNERTFVKYPSVKFFVGGHDMGGGAALRRAMDYGDYVKGVLLYAPTAFQKQVYNSDGSLSFDEDGNPVWQHYTIADKTTPTLLVEVDEALRTDELKQSVKAHINVNCTKEYTIANSISSGFCTHSATETLNDQRTLTVIYTLEFLRSIVA